MRALAPLILVVAALFVGLSGNGSQLPLDEHEVFVARTAEEMLQRGSVIVPYFNDEPRLTKPPVAYWLTMLCDVVGDHDHVISEWEARVPPIAAGVLLALATWSLAFTLFGGTTAFVAGMLLVSSSGFFVYTHSARPEMLYAMFCTAALACFAKSWRLAGCDEERVATESGAVAARISPKWAWLGWVMMGLAILTKGPQLPLILVGSCCVGMWRGGDIRRNGPVLRPFTGLVIAAAVCLWWFLIIWNSVTNSGAKMESETIGRILDFEGEPLSRYLDPYYLYRTGGLILPWALLYALALASPVIREIKMPRAARLLWWIAIVTIALMHVTLNRRWYYLLPLEGLLAALMAWGALASGREMISAGRGWIWRALALLHVVGFVFALIWMWRTNPESLKPSVIGVAAMLAIGTVAAVTMLVRARVGDEAARPLLITAAVALGLFVIAGQRASPWSEDRFALRQFALDVGTVVAPGSPLLGWHDDWQIAQYYLHRSVPSFEHANLLAEALRSSGAKGGGVWLLTNSRKPLELPRGLQRELVRQLTVDKNESVQLWRVTMRGSATSQPSD